MLVESPELIVRNDLQSLQGKQWVNSGIIDGYMALINERDLEKHGKRTVFAFNSSFFNLLSTGYHRVRKWTTRLDLDVFSLDKILVPVNVREQHWVLAVIDLRARQIQIFDSLSWNHSDCVQVLAQWLRKECCDKKKVEFSLEGWQWLQPKCPQQGNTVDCGVFTCCYAECVSLGLAFDFSQQHIARLRTLISMQLLDKCLHWPKQ